MWSLVVIAILNGSPINKNDGSLIMHFTTKEECITAKATILNSWQIEKYRVSASCINLIKK